MKPVKHLSASSNKLVTVPELSYKKRLISSPLSPKPKEKHSAKLQDKLEPMVLRSPPTGESIVRYALPIPSSKTKELIAEDELLRKITKHLKMVVSTLEETYGVSIENIEKPVLKPEHEELSLSVGDDLNSFLVCCSQFAVQLEEAVKEEHHILESLFKWFQQQVNQMEEISKDQSFSEAEFPAPDAEVTLSIAQVGKHAEKLEELKNRLKEGSKYSWKALMSNLKYSQNPPEAMKGYENVQQKIKEFIKTHSNEEFIDDSETEPKTAHSVPNQLNTMFKIFEKQSNMLERARNDQALLETKYKQMESDIQALSEEKLVLEIELQKLKNAAKTKPTYDRTKKTMKMKKNAKEKSEDSEERQSPVKELKTQEDFLKAQKTKPTYDRTKKTMKTEKKNAKEKPEDSEERQSPVKELKTQDFLKAQEAETAKHQLKYFLNQEELLQSEGKTKTTMETSISKTEVKGEYSKYIPLEKETRKAQVADSSGQKTNAKLQEYSQISIVHNENPIENRSEKKRASPAISDLSQILKSQDGSAFLSSSNKVSADEDLSPIAPSKSPDKSFTRVLTSKEIQDLLSVRTSIPGNEAVTASFISAPDVIERRPVNSDISKADILEEKLQSKTEKQTYQEEKEFQVHDEAPHENLTLENETLSALPMKMLEEITPRTTRRNAFLLPQQNNMVYDENQLSEDMDLFISSQSQTKNLEATRNETFNTYDEVPDVKLMSENQESISKTQIQEKNRRAPGKEGLTTQDDVTDEKLMLEQQDSVSKTQMQVKKQRTLKGERYITHDDVPDEILMLQNEASMSETEIQVKKQKTSQDGLITHDKGPDENLMLEHQESLSKAQIQVKKQRTSTEKRLTTQDEIPDEYHTLEHQGSLSKTEIQMKDQRTHKGEGLNALDEIPDKNLKLKHQDSVLKTPVQLKKQKSSIEERPSTHFGVPDKNLMLVNQDSVSKPEMQVKKQMTYRGGRRHGSFGVPNQNLAFVNQDSVSNASKETNNLQVQVKKQIASRRDRRKNQNMNKLSDGSFTLEDLELATQGLKVKNEAGSELPDTAENLPAMNPSISDLIFQLDLNKVVETDIEHLKDVIEKHMLMGEMKIQSKTLLEVDPEQLLDITGRRITKGGIKTQSKSHPGTKVEHLTDATGSGKIRGQINKQPMNLPETDPEQLLDITGRRITQGGIKTQSKSRPETDIEHFTDTVGRKNTIDETKTQLKSYPGVNLFENRDMSAQHQDFFTSPITPSKFSDMSNVSSSDNQGTKVEHLTDATGSGKIRGQINKQPMNLPETDPEQLLDITGRRITQGGIKTQSKSRPETDIEHFTDTVGRKNTIDETKTQLKSYPGVNLFENRDMSAQHQDFFTSPITPSKFSNMSNVSSSDNQGTKVEHLTDATGSGKIRGQINKQPMNLPETDPEQLLDITGRRITQGGIKTQSKSRPETDIEHFTDTVGRKNTIDETKTQLKSYPGVNLFENRDMSAQHQDFFTSPITPSKFSDMSNVSSSDNQGTKVEHLTDATGSGKIRGQINKQPMNLPETDPEQLLDITGRRITQGGIKTQSKSRPETDIEHFTDTVGRKNTIDETKTQLKSYPGVNLFENRDMSAQHQDFFTSPITPSKFSNMSNVSSSDNQGMTLFKHRNISSQHQEVFFPRRITPITFPTKVINLSPFDSQGGTHEFFSPYVTKPSKALPRTFRPSNYKTTRFPPLNKEPSGYPKKLKQKNVGLTITLPTVISKARQTINKGLFFTIWNGFETLRPKPLCC